MVQLVGSLRKELADSLATCKVLVVGAGGIGCELLKNLVLTGFKNIEVIDLDTIDVSNLNRQFLFQKKHVGKSKAQVAKESALQFCPSANITAYHDSIMNPDYNVEFFRKFSLVMNALDNRAARNHVNRMCLAADIPLIESGTAGYLGQVTVIKKGMTECYECQPKPTQKTFPGCTIRNTPSEPIHCIVWAKYLFNQLFGEEDADQEVSPDTADPEAEWNPEETAARATASEKDGDIKRVSTKDWARSTGYDSIKLFNKLFKDDIMYLLTMDKLWKKRKAPTPLDWQQLEKSGCPQEDSPATGLKDQQVLGVWGQCRLFQHSVETLRSQLQDKGEGAELVWDKDDPPAMDFVTAAANLRMHIFSMNMKSRFDVKSMAGNIIPAIATTNAVIAGLIVLEGLKILSGQMETCRTIFLNKCPNLRKKLLVPCILDPPSANCYVCVSKPEVTVKVNVHKTTVLCLQDKILKERFGMVAPDVQIEDGKGTILISEDFKALRSPPCPGSGEVSSIIMVTLSSVVRPLAAQLHRHLSRHVKSHRITPVRRCNLTACSSKYVLSQMHPMWQGPLAVPGGDRQSPIDIVVRKTVFDSELKPLAIDYDPHTCQQIWNNGYSFLVEYDDTTDKSMLKGGPLQDKFRLCQFHFHWGESNAWGSEHTLDRKLFPAELHLVHWNSDKYSLFEEAVAEENGLAVIGVFLKVGKRHEGLQKLVDALPAIRHKGSVVEFTKFDPACLLPSNTDDYWTYHGSLTTPPLTESVTWIVMKQHIEVSHDQLAVFRSLLFTSAEEEVQKSMVNNFRVQQPLCGRTVRSSFTPFLQGAPSTEGDKHHH